MLKVNDETFDEVVLKADKPVFVKFYATWCGPCRMITRALEEVAPTKPDVLFVEVDIDESPNLVQRFQIMSVPTMIMMKDGQELNKAFGYMTQAQLEEKMFAGL